YVVEGGAEYADRDIGEGRPEVDIEEVRQLREIADDAQPGDGEDDAEEKQQRVPLDAPHLAEGIERRVLARGSEALQEIGVGLQVTEAQHHAERRRQAEEALERDSG